MTRPLFALLAVAALAPAAPVPKEKAKATPYPFEVGTKWEFSLRGEDTATDEITRSEEKDGVRAVQVTTTLAGRKKRVAEFELKDGELRLISVSDVGRLNGTIVVWKADMKAGDTWRSEYTVGRARFVKVVRVGEEKEIITPAGKYKAVPVVHTFNEPDDQPEYTDWYVEGVGLVRQTVSGEKQPAQELKSFTPAKDKK